MPIEDLLSIEGFDEELVTELRNRADNHLAEQEEKFIKRRPTVPRCGRRRPCRPFGGTLTEHSASRQTNDEALDNPGYSP